LDPRRSLLLFIFIVKFLGWVMRTKKETPPPPPTKEQELLAEIREKTQNNQRELTFAEFTSVLSDLSGIYMDARRAQVDALNVHKFSDAEYTWVRNRVYEAAGMVMVSPSATATAPSRSARSASVNTVGRSTIPCTISE